MIGPRVSVLLGAQLNCTSLFLVRLLAATTSWEAPLRRITVGSAPEMGPPAGWSEGNINPSSLQLNVRHYRDGATSVLIGMLSSPGLALASLRNQATTPP